MHARAAVSAGVKKMIACIRDAVVPQRCVGCGDFFHHDAGTLQPSSAPEVGSPASQMGLGPDFCPQCRVRWRPVASPFCTRCGVMFTSREGENHLCGRCLQRPGVYAMARAAGIYDQSLKTAVHRLKFKGQVNLSKPLGALLLRTFKRYWDGREIDMVVPVPLHRRRFRQRGFNQAYLLIRRWSPADGAKIVRDLLVRSRPTPPQTGLDRKQRQRNINNAFTTKYPEKIRGKRILLVDDVLTTGATVDSCARTLLNDGARQVDVLTLARAM